MKWLILSLALFGFAANAQVVKCKIDGKIVYSNGGCSGGYAVKEIEVDRSAGVALATPEQVQNNLRQAQRAISVRQDVERLEQERPRQAVSSLPPVSRVGQCATLKEEIEMLYARSRQPLPGYEQDQITQTIRQLRERQVAYKC